MKRICTLLMTSCALMFAQQSNAQSISVGTTAPTPSPGFGLPISVDAALGFTSTNNNSFNEFATNKDMTITSPFLSYPTDQTVIYFKYNLTVSNNPGASSTPLATRVTLTYNNLTLPVTGFAVAKGGDDYYFTLNIGSTLPANTSFRIGLEIDLTNHEKTIRANNFQTNAPSVGNALLPVNFSNFFAQQASDGIALAWNVGQEQNVSGYEVERSTDGTHFSSIGSVAANAHPSYSFIDRQPVTSAYYRIKANDNDGKYKYSSVVSIKGHHSNTVLKAFPTLVQNQLTVQHSTALPGSSVQVFAIDGRTVNTIMPASGAQQTSVDLSSAKAGIYIVRFANGGDVQSLKIAKK